MESPAWNIWETRASVLTAAPKIKFKPPWGLNRPVPEIAIKMKEAAN